MAIGQNTIMNLHKGGKNIIATAKKKNSFKLTKQQFESLSRNFQKLVPLINLDVTEKEVCEFLGLSKALEKRYSNILIIPSIWTATTNISQILMCPELKEDIKTYLYQVIHYHELTQVYKTMRLKRSHLILHQIAEGTLLNLAFTNEKKFDIRQ